MPDSDSGSFLARNSVFRDYLAASSISQLGSYIFDISMPLYMIERTHSATALAMVTVCLTLPYFLMAPLTGYTADHLDKRKMMIFSDIGQVLCMLFLVLYDCLAGPALWPILAVIFVAKSLMLTFETVSTFQLIPALVTPDDLPKANMWSLSSQRIIQILGPLVGGMAMGFLGIRFCIFLNLISFGATLFFTCRLKELNALIDGDRDASEFLPMTLRNIMVDFAGCIRFIWSSPLFKPFIGFMFLWNLCTIAPSTPTLTYYFTELNHFTSAQYGLIISISGLTGIFGFLASAPLYRRFDFANSFVWSAFWQALLSTACLIFFRQPVALATIFALSRVGCSVVTMGTFELRQTQVPRARIGGVNACIRMFFMSAAPVSALFQAFLIDHFGVAPALAMGAVSLWGALWFARQVGIAYEGTETQPFLGQQAA